MSNRDVRNLIDEIAQLSHSDLLSPEFYAEVLERVGPRVQAVATAVWSCGEDDGQLDLLYQKGLDGKPLLSEREPRNGHEAMLADIRNSGHPRLLFPGKATSSPGTANETQYVLAVCPVKVGNRVVSIIEAFQPPGGHPAQAEAGLKLLTVIAGLATNYHRNQELRGWRTLDSFSESIHNSLHPSETAYQIANEGRLVIGCDRLSVLTRTGSKCRILAISGQETVHRRSNSVRLLQRLVQRVLAVGEPLVYPDLRREQPPQLEQALQDYVDEAQSRRLHIVPLVFSETSEGDAADRRPEPEVIGAVVAEQFSGEPFKGEQVEAVARHATAAMHNALEHHRIFLLPLWKALGKATWLVRARTLPKTVAVLALLIGILLGAVFIPAELKLTADGTLQPAKQRFVFARERGTIEGDVPVKHGSPVEQGELILRMRNSEIQLQLEQIQGEIRQTEKELDHHAAILIRLQSDPATDDATINQLAADRDEKRLWLDSLRQQEQLVLARQENLAVRSPVTGEVTSWHVDDILRNRPVQRGDVLMTVAELDGPWILELLLPDEKVGHLIDARGEIREDLQVSYIVATDPEVTLHGTIQEVAYTTSIDEKEGLGISVKVAIDKRDVEHLRSGAKVTGRIHCGQRAIGYVWLYPVIHWLQSRVLFRYF